MNHEVIAAGESRAKDVRLAASRGEAVNGAREGGAPSQRGQKERNEANFDTAMEGIIYDGADAEFIITLSVPQDDFKHVDVQWAADITDGGRFVGDYPGDPTVQCDGRRGVGKKKSAQLKIQIDPTADSVEVWAGWATEHEAVTLTDRLRFVRKGSTPQTKSTFGPPKGQDHMPPPPPGPPKKRKESSEL